MKLIRNSFFVLLIIIIFGCKKSKSNNDKQEEILELENLEYAVYNQTLSYLGEDILYRQIFNSPETSFGQPFLGTVLKLESVLFGAGKAHFVQVEDNAKYK
jgi:ribosomal protein L35AE/L33A